MKYFAVATLFVVSYGLDLSLKRGGTGYDYTGGNLAQLFTNEDDGEWGEAAPTLTSGKCADVENCTECREVLSTGEFECKDTTVYKYNNVCNFSKLSK